MPEKVSIHIGVPTVRQTKLQGNGTIEARAETHTRSFSVHYSHTDPPPTVGEKLLVAVLSGVYPEWLPGGRPEGERGPEPPITYEAVSDVPRGGNDPSRAEQFDTLHFRPANNMDVTRLEIWMASEGGKVHAAAVLNKRQVTHMLAALIAIYPQLHEDD